MRSLFMWMQASQAIVDEVHSPDYWFFASKDGNRETHYRGASGVQTLDLIFSLAALRQQPAFHYKYLPCTLVQAE